MFRGNLPCKKYLSSIPSVKLRFWLASLTVERLERKYNDINEHLKKFNNSWDDVFYVVLSRNFGFGNNTDEFERLANRLPYKYIQKHSDSLFQIEALMFGQAGLLERNGGNSFDIQDDKVDDYYLKLQNEYRFLESKYKLNEFKRTNDYQAVNESIELNDSKSRVLKTLAIPEMRVAQLAALLHKSGRLFSTVLEVKDYKEFISYMQTKPSDYWQTHTSLGRKSAKADKLLSAASLDVIVINTVVPILFAYGKKVANESYCQRAIDILDSMQPERNYIVRMFSEAGLKAQNAADSQALIQLRREYCEKRRCEYCRIGGSLLSLDKKWT